ncbi:MAG: PKD domain-containing protein [Bacteroidetes bacterium]|nr:PKD domain-containing protein [Bacteroidota bacterium]
MFKNRKHRIHLILIFTLLLQSFVGVSDSIKVLYLGNSHTFWHDLPKLTANLALANGDTILFSSNTPGGCTLAHPSNGHLFNALSRALIDSTDWDYVVLQEHSLFAVIDYYKNTYMYPGAKALDSLIKENNICTKTIMQLIWGKKNGGQHCINTYCSVNFDDFSHMQDSLSTEYLRLGDSLSCIVAPTGVAWQQSIENGDPIELFDLDESHPSLAGHYLTACVYYAIMFQKSPEGISYYGGLTQTEANYLQQIADQVVFSNPHLWNLNGNIPEAGFEMTQNENTVYFTDTSVDADSYYWDFGDGTTDTIQNPTHSYFATGSYVITQEVSKYCNVDIAIDSVDVVWTGIPDGNSGMHDIKIIHEYNSDAISIVSPFVIDKIRIYGLDGRLKQVDISGGLIMYHLDMSKLARGIYFISVSYNGGNVIQKIIR